MNIVLQQLQHDCRTYLATGNAVDLLRIDECLSKVHALRSCSAEFVKEYNRAMHLETMDHHIKAVMHAVAAEHDLALDFFRAVRSVAEDLTTQRQGRQEHCLRRFIETTCVQFGPTFFDDERADAFHSSGAAEWRFLPEVWQKANHAIRATQKQRLRILRRRVAPLARAYRRA